MKLLIIGMLSSLFISCNNTIEKLFTKSYQYTNNSGHLLSIMKWKESNVEVFNLSPSQSFQFDYEFNGNGCSINKTDKPNMSASECLLVNSDSLKIIFDDNKSILLKKEDERAINIFNEKNYSYSRIGNQEFFSYEFTNNDYQEAE
ncbi:MAG: hypothetical protein L3J45_04515 [Flavobacteriaceae bacterium]|nr:hypothetical protein [Flavobacteriaceae bacterium]